MEGWKSTVLLAMGIFLIGSFLLGTEALALEEASYRVIEKEKDFELREYDRYIVAETLVEGDFNEVGNEAFRRLFAYISGKNRRRQSIAMTAPVSQEPDSVKIPMTAPVNQERAGEKWRVAFVMPAGFTLETLPEPLDGKVALRMIPKRLMAARRYSGTWSRSRYEEKKSELEGWIERRGVKPAGEPVLARYNPPFTPWFLRRNEVLIPVEAR
jgi:hypothetical protein